jgi:hypothetical protein
MRDRHFVGGVTQPAEFFIQFRTDRAFIAGDGFNIDKPAG